METTQLVAARKSIISGRPNNRYVAARVISKSCSGAREPDSLERHGAALDQSDQLPELRGMEHVTISE